MNILFYHPSATSDGYPEPPLGLAYLMSVARKQNCQYRLYDEDHHSKLIQLPQILSDFPPAIIAISFMTPQYLRTLKAIKRFKEECPNASIIIGGPHATALPERTLKEMDAVDYLCKGEGEKTFEDFIRHLKGELPLEAVDGLFYRKGNQICSNARRTLMPSEELDNYRIEWERLLEYGPYVAKLSYRDTIGPVFPIITARGCPYQCTFCDEGNIWERKVRMRSIDKVVEEIRFLVKKYSANCFNILDDTFTLKKSRLLKFCEKVKPLNLHFRITATVRSVNEQILTRLKQAGCDLVSFGVESGDENVLQIMKKRQSLDDVRRAFRLTREAGILTYALCMVGNLGEDINAVKRTAQLIDELKTDLASCAIMTPYPGSENYRICLDNGWIIRHEWEHWIPSILRTKECNIVVRTDKMNENEIAAAYYYMNRFILWNRFKHKYGRLFFFNGKFYFRELLPRIRGIGLSAFLHHIMKIIGGFKTSGRRG